MDVAAELSAALDAVTFSDLGTEAVSELLIEAVAGWGRAQGWRVYRRAASVVPLPPPMQHQRSVLDVACARPGGPPVVVEVDHADRRRTLDKLAAEAAAGRVAVWVRWGSGRFATPPAPVLFVPVHTTSRRGLAKGSRLHSRTAGPDRPAPAHSAADVTYTSGVLDTELALVLGVYTACARDDLDAAVRDLAPDVDWAGPASSAHGPAAVAARLRGVRDVQAHRRDERIVVLSSAGADVCTVVEGRLALVMRYADPADALR